MTRSENSSDADDPERSRTKLGEIDSDYLAYLTSGYLDSAAKQDEPGAVGRNDPDYIIFLNSLKKIQNLWLVQADKRNQLLESYILEDDSDGEMDQSMRRGGVNLVGDGIDDVPPFSCQVVYSYFEQHRKRKIGNGTDSEFADPIDPNPYEDETPDTTDSIFDRQGGDTENCNPMLGKAFQLAKRVKLEVDNIDAEYMSYLESKIVHTDGNSELCVHMNIDASSMRGIPEPRSHTHIGRSKARSPAHIRSSKPESPAHTGSSKMKLPAYTGSSNIKSTVYTLSSKIKSPVHTRSSKIKPPVHTRSSKPKSPVHITSFEIKSPAYESPVHITRSEIESPAYARSSKMKSPVHITSSKIKAPSHIESFKPESPGNIQRSKPGLQLHIQRSKPEPPAYIQSSISEPPAHIRTSNLHEDNACIGVQSAGNSKFATHIRVGRSKVDEDEDLFCLNNPSAETTPFRENLMRVLRKPFDLQELQMLEEKAILSKKVEKLVDLRHGREKLVATEKDGKAYVDHFPDLRQKLRTNDSLKKLNLLRGFFFWIERLTQEGAFKPWQDKRCHDMLPPYA